VKANPASTKILPHPALNHLPAHQLGDNQQRESEQDRLRDRQPAGRLAVTFL
jgi:hypothetical protein